MKYLNLVTIALILSACNQTSKVELTVKASGIKSGVVILSQHNEPILTQNITDGSATISKPIAEPGYYDVAVMDNDKSLSAKNTFEIYLENTAYTVDVKDNRKGLYPVVNTTSKTQQELSDYYAVENGMAGTLNRTIDSLITYLDTREAKALPRKVHVAFTDKTRGYQIKRRQMEPQILSAYMAKHPDNVVAAHIMAQQYLDEYSKEYNSIFKNLSEKAKSTDDGLKVSNKLGVLTKLLPGAEAPAITGITLDGKAFDRRSIKAKVILIEFWVTSSQQSELNHSKMLNGLLLSDSDKKHFAMLSISTDSNIDVWKRAVKLSNLTWPQVADPKGDNSPNVTNWMIKAVPAYFLVDGHWRIIKANIDIADVD
jgi:hypothetical protein